MKLLFMGLALTFIISPSGLANETKANRQEDRSQDNDRREKKKIIRKKDGINKHEKKEMSDKLVNIDFPEPTAISDIIKSLGLMLDKKIVTDEELDTKISITQPRKVSKNLATQIIHDEIVKAGYMMVISESEILVVKR